METGCNEERSPNREDQNAWWLEPDPVIEFYMGKVDRAAIRENLKLTPGQRVERFQQRMEAMTGGVPASSDSSELKEALNSAPIPFTLSDSDLVVDAYMGGIDRTLIRENLKLSPDQRLLKFQDFMEFLDQMRQAGIRMRAKNPAQ